MTIRGLNKLTPRDIMTLGDGQHSDGGGLYLFVRDNGRLRSWILRYSVNRKLAVMGLGALAAVPLKVARQKRDKLRAQLDEGVDPLAERRKRRVEQDAKKTFAEVAKLTLAKKAGGWKGGASSTSYAAWARTSTGEAKALHNRPVDEIGVEEIKRVVAPLWERASRRPSVAQGRAVRRPALDQPHRHRIRAAKRMAGARRTIRRIGCLQAHPAGEAENRKASPMVEWRDAPAVMARLRQSASMSSFVGIRHPDRGADRRGAACDMGGVRLRQRALENPGAQDQAFGRACGAAVGSGDGDPDLAARAATGARIEDRLSGRPRRKAGCDQSRHDLGPSAAGDGRQSIDTWLAGYFSHLDG